jgi:hypothetical protein
MQNPGETPSKYLVFEFHGRAAPHMPRPVRYRRSLLSKLVDPRCWARKAKYILRRY